MIPHKLQLKNFLSYGAQLQTIDFTPYHLICLGGKNGHGKSALLDAMTWALWGQARKVVGPIKADQGLLRLGQTHMLVVFDFEFGNSLYRIRREFGIVQNKPTALLEFGMIDSYTKELIPLTDKTIRTTQKKIDQTIRLDFESFVNSAFLRQGGSNEFSKKTAKERKTLLANILGLDQYEIIRKLALEKIKHAESKKEVLTLLQEKRKNDLLSEQELILKNKEITEQLTIITTQETEWYKQQQTIEQEQTIYNKKEKEYEHLLFQQEQLEKEKIEQQKNLQINREQWRAIQKQQRALPNNKDLEKIKTGLLKQIAEHQDLFQKSLEYKEKIIHLTQEIYTIEQQHREEITKQNNALALEQERLEAQKQAYKKSCDEYTTSIAEHVAERVDIIKKKEVLEKKIMMCTLSWHNLEKEEKQLEKHKAHYHQFVAAGNNITNELTALSQKNRMIHDDNPSCPLCEQNLSASRRRLLKTNFEQQEHLLRHQLSRLKRIIPTLKEKLIVQHEQLVQNKGLLQQHESDKIILQELTMSAEKINLQIKIKQQNITAYTKDITELTEKMVSLSERITRAINTTSLDKDASYQQCIKQKKDLEKEIAKKQYDIHAHKTAQEELKKIESLLVAHEKSTVILVQQEQRKSDILSLCKSLKITKEKIKNILMSLVHYAQLTVEKQTIINKEITHKQCLIELRKKKEELLQIHGSINSQQKQLEKIKIDYKKEEKNINKLDVDIEDYNAIGTAAGKDGIQALLIEDAIPEIEQEANNILSRLTNNQAHIFIESLRDLKGGGTKETLDIKISDASGIRPYEMFSGGEAFRIDFALRIAISKLLARRAGTALQTLIIDEGFGSQDEEGLAHIMDAIHTIQDNFSKVIIVSHLSTMKDQFPVQFFVEKQIQGSTIHVIEQG